MKLNRIVNNEIEEIRFPVKRWGRFSNPTLAFMLARGFEEVIQHPPIPLTDEEILLMKRQLMEVTPFMFKKALTRSGTKRGQVNALIANPNTGDPLMNQDIQDGWNSASSIRRLDPLSLYVQGRLQWTDEEADSVFILAETFRENK